MKEVKGYGCPKECFEVSSYDTFTWVAGNQSRGIMFSIQVQPIIITHNHHARDNDIKILKNNRYLTYQIRYLDCCRS